MRIIRVFPRLTSMTPIDDYAFVGDPPMIRPDADEVHISVSFTWDILEAQRLTQAWQQYYPIVKIGGGAVGITPNGFTPGLYIKEGATFTSRGCNNKCRWCLVPEREGKLRTLDIQPGHNIQDNNLLQTSREHMNKVFAMLKGQSKAVTFGGGLQSSLIDGWVAGQLSELRIVQLFLAADTETSLKSLERAVNKLSFLNRRQLRCYVLLAYNSETIEQARRRLERVWDIGCLPFAQLYQPPHQWIDYPDEWRHLQREWDRPAAMFSSHPPSEIERVND